MLPLLAILQLGACLIYDSVEISSAYLIPPRMKETGNDFDKRAYSGIRPRSIVVIEYNGTNPTVSKHLPYRWSRHCHGVLINYRVVLGPCSCISYTSPDDTHEVNPWHHPGPKDLVPDKTQYLTFVPPHFKVHLLVEEYVDWRQEVRTSKAVCHPKDNNYHMYDFALITLKETLVNSKIAWLHTAEFFSFQHTMGLIKDAVGRSGNCEIFQWTPRYRVHPSFEHKKRRSWRDLYSLKSSNRLERFEVSFSEWLNCRENQCPNIPWPAWIKGTHKFERNELYCNNTQVPQKICLGWKDNRPLCNITRGTPVFCDVTPEIRGFMGMIVDSNSHCADPYYVTMLPVSFAIDFISKDIRLRQSQEYDKSIPKFLKDMRGITLW